MADERSVKVRLQAEVNDFMREMRRAGDSLDTVMKKSGDSAGAANTSLGRLVQSARNQSSAWQSVGTSVGGVGLAWAAVNGVVAQTGIGYNALQQRSRSALGVLVGGAEAANAQMDRLDDFARTSPFAKDVFIRAQQQMLGFGIETSKVIPYLSAINETVAAVGGNNNDLAEIVRVFSQIQAAGKITAVDLMQLGQRGIDAASLIGSRMGQTGAEIRTSITDGTLDASAALDALASGMQERFGGASDAVKSSFDGAADRIKAAFRDISASFMELAVDPDGGGFLVDWMNGLADFIRTVDEMPPPLKAATGLISGLGAAATLAIGGFLILAPRIVDTVDAIKTLGSAVPTFGRLLTGLGSMARLALPFGGLVVAIGAIAGGLALIEKNARTAVPGLDQVALQLNRVAAGYTDVDRLLTKGFEGREWFTGGGVEMDFQDVENWADAFTTIYGRHADSINASARRPADQLKALVAEIDTALSQMDPERAGAAFGAIADGLRDTDGALSALNAERLTEQFSGYAQIVKDAALEQTGFNLTAEQTVAAMSGQTVSLQRSVGGAWTTFTMHVEDATEAQDKAVISAAQAAGQLRKLFDGYTITSEASYRAADAMGAANEAAEDGKDVFAQQEAALKAAGLVMVDFADGVRVMTEAEAEWYDMVAQSSGSFINLLGAYQQVAAEAETAAIDAARAAEEAADKSGDSWEDFYDGFDVSTSDYIAKLQEQMDAQSEWQTNMLVMSSKVSQGVLDHLASLSGPEAAAFLKAMTTMTEEELAVVEEAFGSGGRLAGNAFGDNLKDAGPILAAIMKDAGEAAMWEAAAEIESGAATLQDIIDSYDLVMTVDGYATPAVLEAERAARQIENMKAVMRVTAVVNGVPTVSSVRGGGFGIDRWMGGPVDDYRFAGGGSPRRRIQGVVHGPGSPTSDDIPAWLSPKEFVHNAEAHSYYGSRFMYAINARAIPKETFSHLGFNTGGTPTYTAPNFRPSQTVSYGGGLSEMDVNRIAAAVMRGASEGARQGALAGTAQGIADRTAMARIDAYKGVR